MSGHCRIARVSFLVLVASACFQPGQVGILVNLLAIILFLVLNIVIGVAALFVAAALFNMSIDDLRSAFVNLAAIFTAPAAVATLFPFGFLVWAIALAIYFELFSWLFDLDGKQVLISVVAIVRRIAMAVTMVTLAGMISATA